MQEGIRAALAVVAVVVLDQWLHWPALMELAVAGLLTCLCDAGGPVRGRLPGLLSFAVLGTLGVVGFGLLRGQSAWLCVVAATLAVFCCTLARAFGQSALQVGNLLAVVVALGQRAPLPPHAVPTVALMFAGGCGWAVLVTIVIWRLHPYQPARTAVASIYRALAELALDLHGRLDLPPDEHAWDAHARRHRGAVRQAIEAARAAVLAAVRAHGAQNARAMQGWMRVDSADRIFALLIALADLLAEWPPEPERERARRMLRMLVPVLFAVGRQVARGGEGTRPGFDRAVGAVALLGQGPDRLGHIAVGLSEWLGNGSRLADRMVLPAGEKRQEWWSVLRTNLSFQSAPFRHALRAALAAGLAFSATTIWTVPYSYWFTITLILTMQPYFALTWLRAVERVLGTIAGGLLAAVLSLVCTTPTAIAAGLFPLAVAALSLRAVSYGLFIALLTPAVILLIELAAPGYGGPTLALLRGAMTTAGGLVALLFSLVVWPIWEPVRVEAELRRAIAAHGRYAAAALRALVGDTPPDAAQQARREAGVASNALEASLQRALLEPRRDRVAQLDAALTIDAALRRMAGRVAALGVGSPLSGNSQPGARNVSCWRDWAGWIAAATTAMAAGGTPAPPPALPRGDPEAPSLSRLAAQVDILAAAAARLAASDSAAGAVALA